MMPVVVLGVMALPPFCSSLQPYTACTAYDSV